MLPHLDHENRKNYNFKITNIQKLSMKRVFRRLVSVGDTLAAVGAMHQICRNVLTLAQCWANGDIQTMMIEQNIKKKITNIDPKNYI